MALIASHRTGTTVTDLVTLGPVQAAEHGLHGLLGHSWGVGLACAARPTRARRRSGRATPGGLPQSGDATHQP